MMRYACFIILLSLSPLFAGENENYWGIYKSKKANVPIVFALGDSGISRLDAFGKRYAGKSISVDFLGLYGNSELLQIKFDDDSGFVNTIKLLLVVVNDRLKLVSGYYMRFRLKEDNSLNIEKLESIEFGFSKGKMGN
ncbi:hypothetical protein [Mesoterricola sediminis]|uniref:hypothetical protein n=1 Tax=Mesoterricola sediminis TaxID=2927980 RepID=UPI00292CA609|nr:hypothetical protein [Mesoterricola sediminis]